MTDLPTLASRCEREKPSRALDIEIALAIGYTRKPDGTLWLWYDPDGLACTVPKHYSASIDAALTLVPKGAWWFMQVLRDGRFQAAVEFLPRDYRDGANEAFTASPALALCAAALRARAAQEANRE